MTLRIGDRDPDRYHLVRALQLRILLRSPLHCSTLVGSKYLDLTMAHISSIWSFVVWRLTRHTCFEIWTLTSSRTPFAVIVGAQHVESRITVWKTQHKGLHEGRT
jgi:hypothetical protein